MTRTVIRHTLSALAAAALISAFAAGPASAQSSADVNVSGSISPDKVKIPKAGRLATKKQGTQNRDDLKSGYIETHELGHAAKKQKGLTAAQPKGLATKKGSQQTGGVQTFGIMEASKNRSEF